MLGNTRKREKKCLELTNICSLYHTDIVPSVSNTKHPLLRVLSDEAGNISLLGRRTPANDDDRGFGGNLDQLVREQVQAMPEINWPHAIRNDSYPNPERLSVASRFRLQKLQLIPSFVRVLDCPNQVKVYESQFHNLMDVLIPCNQLGRDRNTGRRLDLITSQRPNFNIWVHGLATYPAPEVLLDILSGKHRHTFLLSDPFLVTHGSSSLEATIVRNNQSIIRKHGGRAQNVEMSG